jgi:hypothetical protein
VSAPSAVTLRAERPGRVIDLDHRVAREVAMVCVCQRGCSNPECHDPCVDVGEARLTGIMIRPMLPVDVAVVAEAVRRGD